MLPSFLLGLAVLVGGFFLYRWFVTADPRAVKRGVLWIVVVLVGLVIGGLLVFGRFLWALGALPLLVPAGLRLLRAYGMAKTFARMAGVGGGGRTSKVDTRFLHMVLDHDTGDLDGTVRHGPCAGRRLGELSEEEILDLLEACRAEDAQSAQVLEAWLDRRHPEWRDADAAGEDAGRDTRGAGRGDGTMTPEEAYAVLGLEPGADEAAIRAAYHRLIAAAHPDRGGSNWLAAKINRARQVLLGR